MRELLRRFYSRLPLIRESRGLAEQMALLTQRLDSLTQHVASFQTQHAIAILDLALPNHPRFSDPRRLFLNHAQINSQNSEDGIINEIFRRIGITNRVFVEIGVGDGRECNTAFLLTLGWTGFWIDGSDEFVRTAQALHLPAKALAHRVAFVTRENAAGIFQDLGVPIEPDILSIDVDANTFHVWGGLTAYRPRVVVVEYNAAIPPDVSWTTRYAPDAAWDGSQRFGASLKAFEELGSRLGYVLVGCDFCGINAFFVRHDLAGDAFASPFTAENHYEPPRYAFAHRRSHPPAILDPIEANPE